MSQLLTNKNILITGGAGFIGSHIAESILENGGNVRIFDNLSTGYISNLETIKNNIEFIQGDIRDVDALNKSCKGIDIIFHEAAEVSVQKTFENPIETSIINDIGTLNVFETARNCGVKRVVFASSCAVYGNDPELPKKEVMKPNPKSFYAAQKIMGEYYASLYHDLYQLETVCLRYFNVYGPRQDPSSSYSGVISIFLNKAINHSAPTIFGDGCQSRDFVNVADVVRANLLAATQEEISGNVYNIGTEKMTTINELWAIIARLTQKQLTPSYASPRPGEVRASLSDVSKARSELGYSPLVSFEKGLEQTLAWYAQKT